MEDAEEADETEVELIEAATELLVGLPTELEDEADPVTVLDVDDNETVDESTGGGWTAGPQGSFSARSFAT